MSPIKISLYSLSTISMIFFLNLINQKINFPTAKITKYEIICLSSNSISAYFEVDKASVIYWRIYPTSHPDLKPHDLTNISSIIGTNIIYGGGVIDNSTNIYTNHIKNLSPLTEYHMFVIAIPKIGEFPKTIIKIPFSTK
ncbi:MAG: hypothetical protein ACRCTJ_04610 [Brevinema sp.]